MLDNVGSMHSSTPQTDLACDYTVRNGSECAWPCSEINESLRGLTRQFYNSASMIHKKKDSERCPCVCINVIFYKLRVALTEGEWLHGYDGIIPSLQTFFSGIGCLETCANAHAIN